MAGIGEALLKNRLPLFRASGLFDRQPVNQKLKAVAGLLICRRPRQQHFVDIESGCLPKVTWPGYSATWRADCFGDPTLFDASGNLCSRQLTANYVAFMNYLVASSFTTCAIRPHHYGWLKETILKLSRKCLATRAYP